MPNIFENFGRGIGLIENEHGDDVVRAMADARRRFLQYRPIAAQIRVDALNQGINMFRPVNAMLARMYGPQAAMDLPTLQVPAGMRDDQERAIYDSQRPARQIRAFMDKLPAGFRPPPQPLIRSQS